MHKCGTHLAFTVRVAALRNALIKRKVFRISSLQGRNESPAASYQRWLTLLFGYPLLSRNEIFALIR